MEIMSQICRSSLTFLLLVTLFFSQVFCINLSQGYHQRQSSTSPQMANSNKKKYSNDWAVEIHGGPNQMADQIAKRNGFFNLGKVGNLEIVYHFRLIMNDTFRQDNEYKFLAQSGNREWSQIRKMDCITKSLHDDMSGRVVYAEQQMLAKNYKKRFMAPSDPEYRDQWSLLNTGQTGGPAGRDLNVVPAWMQGFTGKGVVVSVVDDGLERGHADLSSNYDPYASWDFKHNDGDPTPDKYIDIGNDIDDHGTLSAGVIGMAKSNGQCGVGVAYECNLGGLKIDTSSSFATASALRYNKNYIDIYSISWGPADWGFVVHAPTYLTEFILKDGVQNGRDGKGNIYIWASGHGGEYFDSCAADGYVSSIYTIGVGAADQSGNQTVYDEECASKMVVTFADNSMTITDFNKVTTAGLNNSCTDSFYGTSAAAPLVSGVIALTLQANSNLTWRDVQYLIAYTSNPNDLVNGDWRVNGAGLRVSHKHGFGAIDAEAMVTRAKRWINVPPQVIGHIYTGSAQRYQPHIGTARRHQPHIMTFDVDSSNSNNLIFLEHVEAVLSLRIQGQSQVVQVGDLLRAIRTGQNFTDFVNSGNHPRRGDISVELTSPNGTASVLLPKRKYDFINDRGYIQWPFMSVHYWGEDPTGQWTLTVSFDPSSPTAASVMVTSFSLRLYGTTGTPVAVASIPSVCHPYCARGCSGPTAADCDVCKDYRLSSTLECVTACPKGTTEQNKYCFGTPI